jgi:hypothetical protein
MASATRPSRNRTTRGAAPAIAARCCSPPLRRADRARRHRHLDVLGRGERGDEVGLLAHEPHGDQHAGDQRDDRHVGADARERLEHLVLGLVEAGL